MDFSKYLIPEDPVMEGLLQKWKEKRAAKKQERMTNRQQREEADQLYDSWGFSNTPAKEIIHQLIEAVKDTNAYFQIYSGKDGNALIKSNLISSHTVRKYQEALASRYGVDHLEYEDPDEKPKYPYGYRLLTVDGVACAYKPTNEDGSGIESLIIPIIENGKHLSSHRMSGNMVALAIVKKTLES